MFLKRQSDVYDADEWNRSLRPVDLQTAATGVWATLALAASPASLTIAPVEHLVAHFALAGAPAGTLDVRPMFEVVVQ